MNNHISTDFIYIILIKCIITSLFLIYLLEYKNLDRLAMMIDQLLYLSDIDMISNNIHSLFLHDSQYESNRTLYSRLLGFFSWLIPLNQPPIIIAVFANTFFHILITYYSLKIYIHFDGQRQKIFIYALAFSPTFTIYSFFALRDILITLVTTAFFYYLLTNRTVFILATSVMIVFLRPFYIAVFALWYMISINYKIIQNIQHKTIGVLISMILLFSFAFFANKFFAPESVSIYAATKFDAKTLISNTLGIETFITSKEGLRADRSTINAVRIFMYDSVLLPMSVFIILISSMILKKTRLIYLGVQVFLIMVFISYTYLAITDKFAFRKLLPILPLMWILFFVWLDNRIDRRQHSDDNIVDMGS